MLYEDDASDACAQPSVETNACEHKETNGHAVATRPSIVRQDEILLAEAGLTGTRVEGPGGKECVEPGVCLTLCFLPVHFVLLFSSGGFVRASGRV